MGTMAGGAPRLAHVEEAEQVAQLWLDARLAAVPHIPRPAHSEEEVIDWFRSVVFSSREVWVVECSGRLVALLVLAESCVEQLYVDPRCTGRGLGSTLIDFAKSSRSVLELWTFQSNLNARRFYERHAFVARETTDGANEEHAPDVRYEWRSPGSAENAI